MAAARFDAAATWASAQVAVRNVGAAVARWSDPRQRLLRKRRAARRATIGLGSATGALTAATVGLGAADVNALLVAGSGGVTALVAAPTVAAALRLRRLLRTPLPAERLPLLPSGSVAREPLRRLAAVEASLQELVGLLERAASVPNAEVWEVSRAARLAGTVLRQEAAELAALQRARDSSAVAARELSEVVQEVATRLDAGVREYELLVAAAARTLATAFTAGPRHDDGLSDAVDRIEALTSALSELGGLPAGRRG